LIQAAVALFSERGFRSPSIQDICDKGGYSRGTFYTHFKDRDELIGAAIEDSCANLVRALGTGDVASMIDNFVAAVRTEWFLSGAPEWRFHHTLSACAESERVRAHWADVLDRMAKLVTEHVASGQRAGLVRDDISAQGIAGLLVALATGAAALVDSGGSTDLSPAAALVQMLAPERRSP
jgi:AcrR family transcriptional regulator